MRDQSRKIGSFMIGVGAIIELKGTNKILLGKRDTREIKHGTWEMIYGRINHHEELITGLKREVMEETGIQDLIIKKLNRIWHIYRGNKHEDTELYGFTFVCETSEKKPRVSEEHSEFMWVEPEAAIDMMTVPGIKKDLELYIKNKKTETNVSISDLNDQIKVF
ncbi:MAG: NUDIX hydrolase [Patescibacteria group bacterium]